MPPKRIVDVATAVDRAIQSPRVFVPLLAISVVYFGYNWPPNIPGTATGVAAGLCVLTAVHVYSEYEPTEVSA